ncbi:MAG: hypothetical protein AB8H80_20490 [Planctomycetota bacterium]
MKKAPAQVALRLLAAGTCLAAAVHAQCAPVSAPGFGIPGANDRIYTAHAWDQDGSGPLPEVLMLGGVFEQAGRVRTSLLVAVDPTTGIYSSLPNTDFSGRDVRAMVTMPNGDLVVGGYFGSPGPSSGFTGSIARFDGQTWTSVGGGIGSGVRALALMPNGDLLAARSSTLGNVPSIVSRWDGTQWQQLGAFSSAFSSIIYDLHVTPTGVIYVGGQFGDVDGVVTQNIARFDGTQWQAVATAVNGAVRAIDQFSNGDLVVAGRFNEFDGVPAGLIVRQNGSSWTSLLPVPPFAVVSITALEFLANDTLVAVGAPGTFGGASIGIYENGAWRTPGSGLVQIPSNGGLCDDVAALANGSVVVAGQFELADGKPCHNVARLAPSTDTWSAIGSGTNGPVQTLLRTADGTVYAGGVFGQIEGANVPFLARRAADGSWQPFAPAPSSAVNQIVELPNGDLVIGGSFTEVGGIQAQRLARWDGSSWHAMGSGSNSNVFELIVGPSGAVLASGSFQGTLGTARWDGTSWNVIDVGAPILGTSLTIEGTGSFARLPNGQLAAIASASGLDFAVLWSGFAWTLIAPLPVTSFGSLLATADGELIYRNFLWNGSTWIPILDLASVSPEIAIPRADGSTWLAVQLNNQHRQLWAGRGLNWSPIDAPDFGSFQTLLAEPNGGVLIGGNQMRGDRGAYLTRIVPTCPAAVQSYGAGCFGAAGPVALEALGTAWTGSELRSRTTGLPPNALVVPTVGFAPAATALPSVIPSAYAGCVLWHSADLLLTPQFAFGSSFASILPIPSDPTLAGSILRTQTVSIEFGQNGIGGVASSNALLWLLGSY